MRVGKLTLDELCKVFKYTRTNNKEIIIGAGRGRDCAAIEGEGLLWISCDPITGANNNSKLGELAIVIGCNDVAAAGVKPLAVLITLIMPKDASLEEIEQIMQDANCAASALSVDIVGGHTEFSDAVNRPIACVTALGFSKKRSQYTPSAGDAVILTKTAAIEGTILLLEEQGMLKQARELYPQLSVLKESEALMELEQVLMHDVTEGGVIGAIDEVCSSKVQLDTNSVPLLDITRSLCEQRGLNPLQLIGSGSMLIITAQRDLVLSRLKDANIKATQIGRVI